MATRRIYLKGVPDWVVAMCIILLEPLKYFGYSCLYSAVGSGVATQGEPVNAMVLTGVAGLILISLRDALKKFVELCTEIPDDRNPQSRG
ncbi:hypothetical protein [Larkinella soli]|uniref:hypothetical protein n=1 Tax=Larkinella soli TaxID=1770527 RepID=UPI000FFC526F|nr:hypothetical protein [Larkinella soli]